MTEPLESIEALLVRICETAAPSFHEQERAKLVASLWQEAGLEPNIDDVGNVVARVSGGSGPRVLLVAHLDTVFPHGTELTVKRSSERLAAPGVGDNSASLAVLTYFLQQRANKQFPNLMVAASVGEEGVGDLYGVRQLMREYRHDIDMMIAVDGHLGTIVNQAVGSKRFDVSIKAKGGHSWGDYPSSSAVHALAEMVHQISRINVPKEPRSSLNVGEISGGTSINSIAQDAKFNLDLRSLDAKTLSWLEHEAMGCIQRVGRQQAVEVDLKQIGDRPAATSPNKALVQAAKQALQSLNVATRTAVSSTDANIAMSLGMPAISFGVYKGADAHRLSEWLERSSLLLGYKALSELLAILSKF